MKLAFYLNKLLKLNSQTKSVLFKSTRFFSVSSRSYELIKPNINIGTIGHIDHGKTTLTAAITKVLSEKNLANYVEYDKIDSAPEEKKRGITINLMHVGYSTEKRNYAHVDCPGHADFIKNMITGTSQMDAAILVIAASEGVMPQTREHLALAKAIGIKNMVVFVNKADLVDKETLELVDLEVRELLEHFEYNSENVPVVFGSALRALQSNDANDELGKNSILKLMNVIDTTIPTPTRDIKSPFFFPIEKSVSITGRGQVLVGTIQKGSLKKGDAIEIVGFGKTIKTTASEIHIFKTPVNECVAGDHVGILARGIKPNTIERGMVAAAVNSVKQTDSFEASIYMLTKNEGGRKNPILPGYKHPLFTRTCNVDCLIKLPQDRDMIMGGDHLVTSFLLKYPLVISEGDRFTIRESLTLTSCTGLITKVLPKSKEEIPGFNVPHALKRVNSSQSNKHKAKK